MSQQNRVNLKSYFLTGSKPTQNQFGDLVDSMVNIKEEGIKSDGSGNTILNQGLTISNSSLDTVGSIRWNGTNFQFRDNSGWQNLSLGGGTSSQWTSVGPDINLLAGKIGIGLPAATSPTYRMEVNINPSVAPTVNTADTIRLGTATIFSDSFSTYFSHRNTANFTSYALSQDGGGSVTINSGAGKTISFFDGGTIKAFFSGGALNIGNATATPGALLLVNGAAAKLGGGNWIGTSDKRLKSNIASFNDGLEQLKKLNPVKYKYNGKAGITSDEDYVGLVAQDVQEILPYMVGKFKAKMEQSDEQETELLTLDTTALSYIMVNAIKELDARMEKLEAMEHATMLS